jgi:hypothetical protein
MPTSTRIAGFVVALGVGFAAATSPGIAWADTTVASSGSADESSATTTKGGSTGPSPHKGHAPDDSPSPSAADTDGPASKGTKADKATPDNPETSPTTEPPEGTDSATEAAPKTSAPTAHENVKAKPERASARTAQTTSQASVATKSSEPEESTDSVDTDTTANAITPTAAPTSLVATTQTPSTAAVSTLAPTPGPVAPIALIVALPARIVNAVLGLTGITSTAGSTPSPISPAPIAQLMWAAFRRLEEVAGLNAPPAVQPVLNTQTYTGSLTTPTPTVSQFLNAANSEYVLGGEPADLVPCTVNGIPVRYTNILTGTSARVWATPQNQLIIAYQGTTGGTNLLFNPLIAITQAIADLQAILTRTTPAAFPDALHFAQRVQAAAAVQGYTSDNIFVTGHSLGGWQAEYVAQHIGLGGIGFESPGLNTTVPGNGANSLFVNTATWGDPASFSSDVPGVQPFAPTYVPGGGAYPHYGPIVLLGDPAAGYPLSNAMSLWGTGIIGDLAALFFGLGNFLQYHPPSVQAYNLDVDLSPDLLPGTGTYVGSVHTRFGNLTIPQFLQATSNAGILIEP